MLDALAIILHLMAINVWVGGMFFVVVVLGKVMTSVHEPEQQALWCKIMSRFFFWVWLAVITLLCTGIGMIATAITVWQTHRFIYCSWQVWEC